LIFLDDLTQEDKFYLIQQIESKISKNIRYNGSLIAKSDLSTLEPDFDSIPEIQDFSNKFNTNDENGLLPDTLEVIEDCLGEDSEDEITPSTTVQPKIRVLTKRTNEV